MREVCFLLDRDGGVLWADASASPAALPDSRARWQAIWRHRNVVDLIAHSHPAGPAAFSAEDVSTMAAIDAGLGRRLRYAVVAPAVTITRDGILVPEPTWVRLLRLASSGPSRSGPL